VISVLDPDPRRRSLLILVRKETLPDRPNLQLPLFRMQWHLLSTRGLTTRSSSAGFSAKVTNKISFARPSKAIPSERLLAGQPSPHRFSTCKQPQANSSQMNTCTKRGEGWGHYVTLIFVGTASPGRASSLWLEHFGGTATLGCASYIWLSARHRCAAAKPKRPITLEATGVRILPQITPRAQAQFAVL
jgi:hypothetical protein